MYFIYQHIENVMQSLDVERYSYESLFVNVSPKELLEIQGSNDFYFLVGIEYHLGEKERGFALISAENTIIELDSDSNLENAIHTDHFNGRITISLKPFGYISGEGNHQKTLTGKCTLNFLRVTPITLYSNENSRKQN